MRCSSRTSCSRLPHESAHDDDLSHRVARLAEVLGAAIGSIILGIYLLISLNVFGMHRNEAFSSLRIQDWKGFLRFQITPDGTLHAYYLGFKKIPRSWKAADGLVKPVDPSKFVCKVEDRFDIP